MHVPPPSETIPWPRRLRRIRRRLRLTQAELAGKIGVSASTYAKWEAGDHSPLRMIQGRIFEVEKEARRVWKARKGEAA